MFKFIPTGLTSKLGVAALKVKSASPTLLFAGGVIGVGATVFFACRATLQLESILDEADQNLKTIHEARKNDAINVEDFRHAKIAIYTQAVLKIGKLYMPSLALAAVSIGMLCGSHNVLSKRNAALTAAYATLEKGFKQYRGNVVNELGEDKDREFLHGTKSEKVVEVSEDGKKKVVTKTTANGLSPYGVLFNEHNGNYIRNNPGMNFVFLNAQQNYLNDKLQAQGYLLLNDVYDSLGFDRTKAGMVVGWLANGNGDGFVDFGIFDKSELHRAMDFMVTPDGEIYLDFNVDGVIFDKLRG